MYVVISTDRHAQDRVANAFLSKEEAFAFCDEVNWALEDHMRVEEWEPSGVNVCDYQLFKVYVRREPLAIDGPAYSSTGKRGVVSLEQHDQVFVVAASSVKAIKYVQGMIDKENL